MIKILIADDHAIVRRGLKQILEDTPNIVVADEASTGKEVLEKISEKEYDVVVLDISLPDKSGLDILKQLKSQKPKLPVLVLSIYPEEQYAERVLKIGASGYLTKESAPEELITAIKKVSVGGKYITASLAEKLAFNLDEKTDKLLYETLSDREFQVMCSISSGKTQKEIAAELSLSIKTISTYRYRILEKMRMKSNAELTRYAMENKLVN
jgi:DNA-binding NarL/FixJ family response regulator